MIIGGTLTDDALQPCGGTVTVELQGPGFHEAAEAVRRVVIDVPAKGETVGRWSRDLPANSDFRVAGTVYTVQLQPTLGRVTHHTIRSLTDAEAIAEGLTPGDDGVYLVWDLLTDQPGALAPAALTSHAGNASHVPAGAAAGDVPTWDPDAGDGGRYVAAPPAGAAHPDGPAHAALGLATTSALTTAVADLQALIDAKASPADITAALDAFREQITGLAPELLDTFEEVAAAIANNEDGIEALLTAIGTKADASALAAEVALRDEQYDDQQTHNAATVPRASGLVVVDAGSDLAVARPTAAAVLFRFDTGVDVGEEGANVVNGEVGDLYFVASA